VNLDELRSRFNNRETRFRAVQNMDFRGMSTAQRTAAKWLIERARVRRDDARQEYLAEVELSFRDNWRA
jgi:hypothetical protein